MSTSSLVILNCFKKVQLRCWRNWCYFSTIFLAPGSGIAVVIGFFKKKTSTLCLCGGVVAGMMLCKRWIAKSFTGVVVGPSTTATQEGDFSLVGLLLHPTGLSWIFHPWRPELFVSFIQYNPFSTCLWSAVFVQKDFGLFCVSLLDNES